MSEIDPAVFEKLKAQARRVMGEAWPLEQLTPQSRFEDLGIDSLHLTEIAVAFLGEVDLYVPMAKIARTKSVGEFLALISEELAASR